MACSTASQASIEFLAMLLSRALLCCRLQMSLLKLARASASRRTITSGHWWVQLLPPLFAGHISCLLLTNELGICAVKLSLWQSSCGHDWLFHKISKNFEVLLTVSSSSEQTGHVLASMMPFQVHFLGIHLLCQSLHALRRLLVSVNHYEERDGLEGGVWAMSAVSTSFIVMLKQVKAPAMPCKSKDMCQSSN